MAIALDTVVAIRKYGNDLTLSNFDSDEYGDISFSADPHQSVDVSNHTWGNYFLSAYKGVWEAANNHGIEAPTPQGLQVMIHGQVPTGAGVSSSAAIVCASSLAILAVHGLHMTKGQVAEFTALSERHVGVTSGGMDQAISIMAMPGTAKLVEFNPVRATDVVLPQTAAFVICNSLAVSNKAEKATKQYNLRVVECRLATAMLALAVGQPKDDAVGIKTLKELEPLLQAKFVEGAAKAAESLLHEDGYSHSEIENALGMKLTDFYSGDAAALRVLDANAAFKLRDRAVHVFSEKQRVVDFAAACSSGASLSVLGVLMDASHASLRDLYECSCPELESLVAIAKKSGAIGARLTGAGWGGCAVSLVQRGQEDEFIACLIKEYLNPLIESGKLSENDIPKAVFASLPSSGAAILHIK